MIQKSCLIFIIKMCKKKIRNISRYSDRTIKSNKNKKIHEEHIV